MNYAAVRSLLKAKAFFVSFNFKVPAEASNKISEIHSKRNIHTHHLTLV